MGYALQEKEFISELPYSKNFVPSDPRVRALIKFRSGLTGTFFNTALTEFTYFEIELLFKSGKIRSSDNGSN